MLENLKPAEEITAKVHFRPTVDFDGNMGFAQTGGLESEPENFDEFLRDAGIDPANIEVIPPVRTSRWQQQRDGDLIWLTSYRFTFRRKTSDIDLPLLYQQAAQRTVKPPKRKAQPKALVVLWSDLQVGKVDMRGGLTALMERAGAAQAKLLDLIDRERPAKVIFADMGDTVENFDNRASMQQLQSNEGSIMEQVDLATTLAWNALKAIAEQVPEVIYASIGSNHCQWRRNGQVVGKPTDDWGVFIGRQLARIAGETNAQNIRFIEPQPEDESLAFDIFDDGYHILGLVHGHQARRIEGLNDWWRKQAFGSQPVAAANILCHGHFHHLRIEELGNTSNGNSRYIIGASTLDNGSGWWRRSQGEESVPGLVTFFVEQGIPYTGTIHKL